jgi:hypothetical protein
MVAGRSSSTAQYLGAGKLVKVAVQKTETRSMYISPYTNINSKWIKDLNIRPQTLVQERVGNTLELVGIGKKFSTKPR